MSLVKSTMLFAALCLIWLIDSIAVIIYDCCDEYQLPHVPTHKDSLVAYLSQYNPLADYYDTLSMGPGDIKFVDKLYDLRADLPSMKCLSGIMLLKIYFKRADIKQRLTAGEYADVISYAQEVYDQYTTLVVHYPREMFIPDMFGYRDIAKKSMSSYSSEAIALNELFYISS
jgi:hypothetical protein